MKLIELQNDPSRVDEIFNLCEPYLESIKFDPTKMLWRGMNLPYQRKRGSTGASGIHNVPKNRKPIDTMDVVHSYLDNYLEDKLGHKFRSNALFCSGNKGMAEPYGKLYAIFPIGDFEYAWSQNYHDATLRIADAVEHITGIDLFYDTNVTNDSLTDEQKSEIERVLGGVLDSAKYKNTGLIAAIKSGHEIMINCEKYYALSEIAVEFEELERMMKVERAERYGIEDDYI